MAAAIALSRRGLGLTSPNPSVGAIVVRDGVVIGRGVTAAGGRPHAERLALEEAGERARGATIYVTLEPCARRSQRGDTAACADLIAAAGIVRVVAGADDPSPHAASEGLRRLAAMGIALTRGIRAADARRVNLGHVLRMTDGRPLLDLKLAETPDGYAATADRKPLAITGEAARARVHMMRAMADAILVGVETVLADDPQLTCRLPGLSRRSPVRIVLDRQLRLPVGSVLAVTARNVPVWAIGASDAPVERERALRRAGVEVMRVGRERTGRLDLREALRLFAASGITRVFCEGGPTLAVSLAEADLIDSFALFTGVTPLGRPGWPARPGALARWTDVIRTASDETLPGGDRLRIYERTR